MSYLNQELMASTDVGMFQHREPYPWLNPEQFLTDEAYSRLLDAMPDAALFEQRFGEGRAHGQTSHDRLVLEYHDGVAVPDCWHEFIHELRDFGYRQFLCRLFGRRSLRLNFHWHYTPRGCSVSPHCDAKHKLGSHIFYFNTAKNWDESWGGETVLLDDGGRFDRKMAPAFEDFDHAVSTEAIGNRSLLFARRDQSWHGVRELRCPEGNYRKVFIVVVNDGSLRQRIRTRLKGKKIAMY